jgi:hypothetical protein
MVDKMVSNNKTVWYDEKGLISKDVEKAIRNEKIFVEHEKDWEYYYPLSAKDHIKDVFERGTVIENKRNGYLMVSNLVCKHWKYGEEIAMFLDGGEISKDELCNRCKYMMLQYVGECTHNKSFAPLNGDVYCERKKPESYLQLKPGYAHEWRFSRYITMKPSDILENMNSYKRTAAWRECVKKIRKEFCENCYKYRSQSCQDGYTARNVGGYGSKPHECIRTKKEIIDDAKERIKDKYGSMNVFFHLLCQSGRYIKYKDPLTNRTSERVLSVPYVKNKTYNIKTHDWEKRKIGFYMAWSWYPFEMKNTTYEHITFKQCEKERNTNFITLRELEKNYGVEKKRYRKKYDELLATALLYLYKARYTPGSYVGDYNKRHLSIGLKHNRLEIKTGDSYCKHGKTQNFESMDQFKNIFPAL